MASRSSRIAEFPSFETLPDIVRKCRRIAEEIGASDFAFVLIPASGAPEPIVDGDYPGVSGLASRLAAGMDDRLVRLPSMSPIPCWWSRRDLTSHAVLMMERLRWAKRIDPVADLPLAIAYPLMSEGHADGLAVFAGEDLILSDRVACEVHQRCLALFAVLSRLHPSSATGTVRLSRREIECLRLTAGGLTSQEIADQLGLSANTANQYLTSSGHKLNATNRTHAVAKALRAGLID
ncbi:MAG: helix-turn-helix transcriptional regulator [Rhizobiaceae bacterium]|nr:helix-turn-helix transcriptional regulator [Rhizobiaceae bacterium]